MGKGINQVRIRSSAVDLTRKDGHEHEKDRAAAQNFELNVAETKSEQLEIRNAGLDYNNFKWLRSHRDDKTVHQTMNSPSQLRS